MPSSVLDIITRHWRKDTPEEEAEHQQVTATDPVTRGTGRKRGQALPMSYERRLASYGLRDENGPTGRTQTPAQRKRIRKKLGHASRRAAQ